MTIDRRTLLRTSCLTAASSALLPRWAMAGPLRDRTPRVVHRGPTALVVVQMGGGNDGLNTVVPIADPAYAAARPRLAFDPSETLRVDGRTGLHPALGNLQRRLEEGKLAIVQGVGYPTSDLSHFHSLDVWQSAVPDRPEPTGWIGRTLDALYGSAPDAFHSVSCGFEEPLAVKGNLVTTPVVFDPTYFGFQTDPYYPQDDAAKQQAFRAMLGSTGVDAHDFIAHAGSLATSDYAAIQTAMAGYASGIAYPDTPLGSALKFTASVLFAEIGPRIFWVMQDGYDTHGGQRPVHDALLRDLDASLDAFYSDCVQHSMDRRVLVLTWSEFGRRVEDNASDGTDHGGAAPLFVLGGRVRGGFFGEPPSLTDLDPNGNLRAAVDFRQVYASIIANWLDADPNPVLFGDFDTLSFV